MMSLLPIFAFCMAIPVGSAIYSAVLHRLDRRRLERAFYLDVSRELSNADAVWDILVGECGANEEQRAEFLHHWPACREFRFQGALGFGGKVYAAGRRVFVGFYSEDRTPARIRQAEAANDRLAELDYTDSSVSQ